MKINYSNFQHSRFCCYNLITKVMTLQLAIVKLICLWCLTPLSTIFRLYRGGHLMMEETGVPDKLHHIMLYRLHLVMKGVRSHNIRGTDYTGSCKSNYHTFMTTTTPRICID